MGPSLFHLVPVFDDPLLGRCRCDSITYGDAIHCPQWRFRQGKFCRRLCQSVHDIIVLDVFLFLVRVVSFNHPVAWDPSLLQLLGPLLCLYYLPQVYIRAFPMWCYCPIIHYCFVVYDQLIFLICQTTHNSRPLQFGPL